MRALVPLGIVAVGVALAAARGSAGAVAAQTRFPVTAFPASEGDVVQAVCPPRGRCRLDFVLFAGRHGTTSLAVVRVRSGAPECCDEPGYRDFLVSSRSGVVRRERELARGTCPCLEWEISRWRFAHGELVFTYGMMGAPPAAGTDMRATTLHIRPWPLAITSAFIGADPMAAPALPARGPFAVLSMD